MEVVAASPSNGAPFHNHDVREWSRLDSITGVLERARLETDHWAANTATSSHKYNKVVDSRARSGADGNLQQKARRKLEVFQSQAPGSRLQVIKTQTVSSSRWSNVQEANGDDDFGDLKLSLNPLDLTTEKSKASVGRSVGRRPPSRSRIRDDILARNLQTNNLQRVSRLCHQVHNSSVKTSISDRQSGDGVEVTEIEPEDHRSLSRTKSTSSEDLQEVKKGLEDLEDLEQLQTWRRTSKLRRSLQYPKHKSGNSNSKPPDLPENTGSVRKIREDLETGRRLSAALNNVDLDALDQILISISNSGVGGSDQKVEEVLRKKRDSFVTVESIQAVRDRLRRTSSPCSDLYAARRENEEPDDGFVTEDQNRFNDTMNESRVKSYVFGMENLRSTKNVSGTGSLESRAKPSTLSTIRNDDWFSRRKSYGFEQMHSQHETISSKNKTRMESSTDSGICRSSEIVVVPTPTKRHEVTSSDEDNAPTDSLSTVKKYALIFEKNTVKNNEEPRKRNEVEATTITIPINNYGEIKRHSIAVDESKYMQNKQNHKFKRTSLAIDDDDDSSQNRRQNKKVEFCKTEVHFAADSGRVNIVETDEKPPPTQNFRRRRRNAGLPEDFTRNGLPVLRFGDTSYEKLLFADNDCDYKNEAIYENVSQEPFGTVTVNANGSYRQDLDESRDNTENEIPKGILKNKPKPYILGEDSDSEQQPWGVRLRTKDETHPQESEPQPWGVKLRPKEETTPLWRSTVTVKNTFYDQNEDAVKEERQPEFQRLLKQLRPTSKKIEDRLENKRNSDDLSNIRILSPTIDTRRSSWSVADRVKQVEDLKWTENKGYSTKVNFGDGEATVVENRHPTWPRREEYSKDLKRNLLNKGLVVRIGRNDTNSKHTVCSKTTTNSDTNGTTTTTKITIDLTPSPTEDGDGFKFPRSSLQSFKSPSLIMSTFKGECLNVEKMPQQLEALRKLYEEVHSDSEADKEVHQILMNTSENHQDDGSSVVSGSWSKMRAFKHVNHFHKVKNGSHALSEKVSDPSSSVSKSDSVSKFQLIDAQIENDLKHLKIDEDNLKEDAKKFSPIVLRKHNSSQVPSKSAFDNEQLSSPYLVGRNQSKTSPYSSDAETKFGYQSNNSTTRNNIHNSTHNTTHNTAHSTTNNAVYSTTNNTAHNTANSTKLNGTHNTNHSTISNNIHSSNLNGTQNTAHCTKPHGTNLNAIHNNNLNGTHNTNLNGTQNTTHNTTHNTHNTNLIATRSSNLNATRSSNLSGTQNTTNCTSRNGIRSSNLNSTQNTTLSTNLNATNSSNHNGTHSTNITNLNGTHNTSHSSILSSTHNTTQSSSLNSTHNTTHSSSSLNGTQSTTQGTQKVTEERVVFRNKSTVKDKVLRQPKKSQMAYFGVKVSPETPRKESTLSEKPDLLQFSPINENKKRITKTSTKTRDKDPKGPIYENLEEVRKKPNVFDSSILEELTKAADQILQAVNGYTDEEHHSKYTSDDDVQKREPLDTISETRSWRQKTTTSPTKTTKLGVARSKLKTSSNSSIDSITRECTKTSDVKRPFMTKSAEQKQRKKVVPGDSIKANTKARRLQRASSREALLQSHGSSSEDLAGSAEVVRKPRLVKKTKTVQLTVTNGPELKKPVKKREEIKAKHEERVPVIGLPEIRHKTAVSTIRSTAEKAAISREKAKLKIDDTKKTKVTKRETSKGLTSPSVKSDRTKISANRDIGHRHTSVTTPKKATARGVEAITKH